MISSILHIQLLLLIHILYDSVFDILFYILLFIYDFLFDFKLLIIINFNIC